LTAAAGSGADDDFNRANSFSNVLVPGNNDFIHTFDGLQVLMMCSAVFWADEDVNVAWVSFPRWRLPEQTPLSPGAKPFSL
jgi:hypothetical protein